MLEMQRRELQLRHMLRPLQSEAMQLSARPGVVREIGNRCVRSAAQSSSVGCDETWYSVTVIKGFQHWKRCDICPVMLDRCKGAGHEMRLDGRFETNALD